MNHNFDILNKNNHLHIEKIKSVNNFTVGLFSDGNLYAWGKNENGAMGIRKNLGIKTDDYAYIPTPVVRDNFEGEKVVDFDVGFNTLVLLTGINY